MHGRQQTALERFRANSRLSDVGIRDVLWLADWKEFNLPYCSLYVISTDGEWPCKIGVSVSPYRRVMSIQTSVWRPLSVSHCVFTPSVDDAKKLEKAVHRRLSEDSRWLHGEWFDLKPKQALEMVEFVAMIEGIEISYEPEEGEVMRYLEDEVREWRHGLSAVERRDVYNRL